jgi:hypothetical protein
MVSLVAALPHVRSKGRGSNLCAALNAAYLTGESPVPVKGSSLLLTLIGAGDVVPFIPLFDPSGPGHGKRGDVDSKATSPQQVKQDGQGDVPEIRGVPDGSLISNSQP